MQDSFTFWKLDFPLFTLQFLMDIQSLFWELHLPLLYILHHEFHYVFRHHLCIILQGKREKWWPHIDSILLLRITKPYLAAEALKMGYSITQFTQN